MTTEAEETTLTQIIPWSAFVVHIGRTLAGQQVLLRFCNDRGASVLITSHHVEIAAARFTSASLQDWQIDTSMTIPGFDQFGVMVVRDGQELSRILATIQGM